MNTARKFTPWQICLLTIDTPDENQQDFFGGVTIPVEIVSFVTPDGRVLVRTWPGRPMSAIWVKEDQLRFSQDWKGNRHKLCSASPNS